MAIRVVQLGSSRHPYEGVRLGTVRYVPRGVRKEDRAKLDYFDVWLPVLAPSARLMRWWKKHGDSRSWSEFTDRYRREVERDGRDVLNLLAALSRDASFSVGCYCADEDHCHRSVLGELLILDDWLRDPLNGGLGPGGRRFVMRARNGPYHAAGLARIGRPNWFVIGGRIGRNIQSIAITRADNRATGVKGYATDQNGVPSHRPT